ncbi:hypothetical protein RUM44_010498 [Polyplax serrata]|uniref:ATP synthase F1 complex delta/epsilon subunit N-terminal domain-containing protein n=1 Tax=Polyplax serrata TaxID=468196 RepID=A0ABR1AVR5_POLSC
MASFVKQLRPTLRFLTKFNATSVRGFAEAATGPVKDMPLTLAAANQVFYDDVDVKQIDVPTFNGVFGILPKHVPTIAVLQPGVVTVYEKDGASKKIFVSSGTLCVNDDSSVQVLAEEAHYVEDIDVSAAKDSLSKAQSELQSASAENKNEAAIAVEVAEAIVKAVS